MQAEEIRGLNKAEIENRLHETDEQMFRLRFQIGMGQTDGVKKYRELRREKARMLGILREREIAEAAKGK
jgi:large subunit ribosomal protein L29